MKFHEIKDNTTLIVNSANIRITQKKLLQSSLKGIRITPLEDFIYSLGAVTKPNWTLKYECYMRFKELQKELTLFKSPLLSVAFISECLKILNQLHAYQIPASALPDESPVEHELKMILTSLYDLKTPAFLFHQIFENAQYDLSYVAIDIQYPDMIEKIWIVKLTDMNARLVEYDKHTPVYEYHHANNPRCEIEAIAQKIIREHMDSQAVMIAVCNTKQLPLISSIFQRYHIPVMMRQSKPSALAYRCAALLNFALHENAETFNECLHQQCFGEMKDLIKAQKYYPYSYHDSYPEINAQQLQGECFSESEICTLAAMIAAANRQKAKIYSDCTHLTAFTSYRELFLCVDKILRTYMEPTSDNIASLKKIQRIFREALPYIQNQDDLALCLHEIKKLTLDQSLTDFNGVSVLPLSDVNSFTDIVFVTHTTQNDFSLFTPANGIFDEAYLAKIKTFPTLQERYDYRHLQLMNKISDGEHIYLSYPLSDYLGKGYESALDIEQLLHKDSTLLPLVSQNPALESIKNLTPETAYDTYVKDHHIKGSVSSLEKFIGCPYAYFLRYGCHIKEPIEEGFNVQKIGTLYHAVMEALCSTGKEYAADTNKLLPVLERNLHDMCQIFPHLDFSYIKNRFIDSMKINLQVWADMEQHSFMTPHYFEYKWENTLSINEYADLQLCGFVDRIDISPTAFRIIDYKSSVKKLDKVKVFTGEQLQLCTYLSVMHKELGLRPLGAFYYSFLNPKLDIPYQKLNRKTKEAEDLSFAKIQQEYFRLKRLQGWVFDDHVEIMDDDASHILGLSNTKKDGVHAKKILNIQEISDSLDEIMKQIADNILSGNVQCEPNEAACMFCPYRPICRFQGTFTEKKQLIPYPSCLREEESYE